jgi:hypothetical protein
MARLKAAAFGLPSADYAARWRSQPVATRAWPCSATAPPCPGAKTPTDSSRRDPRKQSCSSGCERSSQNSRRRRGRKPQPCIARERHSYGLGTRPLGKARRQWHDGKQAADGRQESERRSCHIGRRQLQRTLSRDDTVKARGATTRTESLATECGKRAVLEPVRDDCGAR